MQKSNHNKKLLQSTEQNVVPKQLDLLSNTSKICELRFYRCAACLILPSTYFCCYYLKFENQTLSQLKEWLKRKR